MLNKSQGQLPNFQRFTVTFKNEFSVQRHMINVPNCGSIADFSRKLSSDRINKIRKEFSKLQILNVTFKKVGSSEFFIEKILGKDTGKNLISYQNHGGRPTILQEINILAILLGNSVLCGQRHYMTKNYLGQCPIGWGSKFRTTKCRTTNISKFEICQC